MKIFLAGGDNGAYPGFAYQCKKAFEELNHEVKHFNYRHLKLSKLPISRQIFNKVLKKEALKFNPDLFLTIKGETITKGIIKSLSVKGIKTANWTLDSPFGDFYAYNKINNISEYNNFFVFDPFYLEKLKEVNSNSFYLPCAADPDIHKEVIPLGERNYKFDTSFLGSYEPEREKFAQDLSKFDLHLFGPNWKGKENIIKNLHHGYFSGDNMAKLFNLSKINLNLQALHGRESMNLRTFEVPSTRSFMLTDFKKDLPNLFKIDKEIVCYSDIEDLKEKIKYYLENPEKRDKIIERGHERILQDHKVIDRVKTLLKIVKI
jgi:spore maturation protein CgeB